jgi:hypothetical protein
MAEIELPMSFSLKAEDPRDNRFVQADIDSLFYTSAENSSPRHIGLMVFFSRNEYPGLDKDLNAESTRAFLTVRIFELDPDGSHRVVSSYAEINDPEAVYLAIAGGPEEGYKARLTPKKDDFAFGSSWKLKGNDYDMRTHTYGIHKVDDIHVMNATIRLAKTLN